MDNDRATLPRLQNTPFFTFDASSESSIPEPGIGADSNTGDRLDLPARKTPIMQPVTPLLTIDRTDVADKSENMTTMAVPQDIWATPSSQSIRPRPTTIHEGFPYCMSEAYHGLTSWDSTGLPFQQTPGGGDDPGSRPISVHQDYFPATMQKSCDDKLDFQLDAEMNIGQAYTTDEAIPVLDLRYSNGPSLDGETLHFDGTLHPRRMSGSSFTVSTSGGLSEMPSYEDFSATLSDAPSFSDYPPPSNRNSLMSSTQLSPVASPRMTPQSRSELVRTQSRGRASPSPRPGLRAAPYSVEGARNKRWSTGSYGTLPNRRSSPFVHHGNLVGGAASAGTHDPFGPRLITSAPSHHSSPTIATGQLPLNMGNLQQISQHQHHQHQHQQHPFFLSAPQLSQMATSTTAAATTAALSAASGFTRHSMLLPTQLPSQAGSSSSFGFLHQPPPPLHHHHLTSAHHPASVSSFHPHPVPSHHPMQAAYAAMPRGYPGGAGPLPSFDPPPPLLSHNLFHMLQSNADLHSLHGHYADLSDPPDLYASLQEEPLPPPPEDMNPADPDMVPHEQELRFSGDLYTPRWVRGHGNKREGWCGICKPGRWLVLKNSAFWYDKSFTHGISAATGNPFQEPQETRRMDGNPDVWEGLCSSCNEWIALVSSKKKGTTWFRHAYKCHSHPKIKDAPKRRRESNHPRLVGTAGGHGHHGQGGGSLGKQRQASPPSGQQQQQQQQQRQQEKQSQAQQRQQQQSGYMAPPKTPLTPQMTPVPASATIVHGETARNSTPTGGDQNLPAQVQVPMPVPVCTLPSDTEQSFVKQEQSSLEEFSRQMQARSLQEQQQQDQERQQQQQKQQQEQPHQQQSQYYSPSYPPPPQPSLPSPLQIYQQRMSQAEAMQQQQQQQQQQQWREQPRSFQQFRPPPPPPPSHPRPMIAPMASMEGLGNMI